VVLFRRVGNLKICNFCPLESRSLLIFPVRLPVLLYVKRVTDELPNSEKVRNVFADWIVGFHFRRKIFFPPLFSTERDLVLLFQFPVSSRFFKVIQ